MLTTHGRRLTLLSFLGVAACSDGSGPVLPPCTAGGFAVTLAVGEYVALDPAGADSGCAVFPANPSAVNSAEYLVVPQLAGGDPGRTSGFRLAGDTIRPAPVPAAPRDRVADLPAAEQFHAFLRRGDERRSWGFAPRVSRGPLEPTRAAAAGPPALGSLRTFKVCARLDCTQFNDVRARVRAVKSKVAIYVDTLAPSPGLDSAALDSIAELFDTRLYAVDTAAFGRESDVDTNSVVLILMTNVVNRLVTSQQCQSGGFVAGFFLGADLDPLFQNDSRSNQGEVFYSVVADPLGTLSCAHSTDQVKRIIPVTFIHEFQHMISFNQHVLVRGGDGELLWLNEAFSHFAEELGGRSFGVGTPGFSQFAVGNVFNAYQYLDSTGGHFLLPTEGIGSLAERGAAWLFVRYMVDRYAGDTTVASWNAFTRGMVETSLTGAANVAGRTGDPFTTIVTRWALANWVSDLPAFTAPPELQYESWSFRTTYASLNAQDPGNFPKAFPLTPTTSGGQGVDLRGTLRAGSGVYHRAIQGPSGAGFTLLFGAPGGWVRTGPLRSSKALDPVLAPRLNIIRIR